MTESKFFVPELTQADVPGGACCAEETTFATLFPSYLEAYIKSVWPAVEEILSQHHLVGKLDLIEGSMTVATTRRTWDPYVIVDARDFIKLLARNVPLAQAQKIFQVDIVCDIIKIGSRGDNNTRRFVKRRDRLVGPKSQTLKALEILTGCYVLVQGKTVATMGPAKGTQMVRKIVEDCMNNIHPIYGLKRLLLQRELSKRDDMKNEDWSRFLPVYKKSLPNKEKRQKLRKALKERAKKQQLSATKKKSIFPPAPPKRLEDLAMESGKAFLLPQKKRNRDEFELAPARPSNKRQQQTS